MIKTYIYFDKLSKKQLGLIDKDDSSLDSDFVYFEVTPQQIQDINYNGKQYFLNEENGIIEDFSKRKESIRIKIKEFKETCKVIKFIPKNSETNILIDADNLDFVLKEKIDSAYAAKENCLKYSFTYRDPKTNDLIINTECDYSNETNTGDVVKILNNLIYDIDQKLISFNRNIQKELEIQLEKSETKEQIDSIEETYQSKFTQFIEISEESIIL